MQTRWTALAAVALTVWLGLESIRTSLAMIVWNIGEDRPPTQLALIALCIWLIGVLVAPLARRLSGRRPEVPLAALFGLVVVANAVVAHPVLTPVLGTATLVTWLWFLPTLVLAIGRAGAADLLTPGIIIGVAAQVALQHALHGMDLAMLRGPLAGAIAIVLAAALVASTRALRTDQPAQPTVTAGWGLVALGPYLVLQLTLLANTGRVQMLGDLGSQPAAAMILLGLVAGCGLLTVTLPRTLLGTAAVGVVLVLGRAGWLQGHGVWLVALLQALLVPLLAAALTPVAPGRPARVYGGLAGAAVLILLFLFLFYSRYGWPALWQIMGLMAVVPAIVTTVTPRALGGASRVALQILVIGGLGIGVHAATQPGAPAASGPAPVELRVLTYNIHMAFDAHSVPAPEAVARVIDASRADLVALQEVGRGWTVNGGADLASWLQWRLPQYRLIYGPMNGDLWGNVILSRYPISRSGTVRYPIRQSAFQRGLVWATVPSEAGEVLFVNTHFSAYGPYEPDRLAQAGDLVEFWRARPRTIIAGDFNAVPTSPVIKRVRAAGLRDLTTLHGLGDTPTYSALGPYERIDYIFASSDVESLAAAVSRVTASDHLPVLSVIRLR